MTFSFKRKEYRNEYTISSVRTCPVCDGSGLYTLEQPTCPTCDGKGLVWDGNYVQSLIDVIADLAHELEDLRTTEPLLRKVKDARERCNPT